MQHADAMTEPRDVVLEEAITNFPWAKFNIEMRKKYGHPKCEFCGKYEACFCQKCIAPNSYEQCNRWYCHRCQAERVRDFDLTHCPTCGQKWPADRPVGEWRCQ